jgi:hypothetical protein
VDAQTGVNVDGPADFETLVIDRGGCSAGSLGVDCNQ